MLWAVVSTRAEAAYAEARKRWSNVQLQRDLRVLLEARIGFLNKGTGFNC